MGNYFPRGLQITVNGENRIRIRSEISEVVLKDNFFLFFFHLFVSIICLFLSGSQNVIEKFVFLPRGHYSYEFSGRVLSFFFFFYSVLRGLSKLFRKRFFWLNDCSRFRKRAPYACASGNYSHTRTGDFSLLFIIFFFLQNSNRTMNLLNQLPYQKYQIMRKIS